MNLRTDFRQRACWAACLALALVPAVARSDTNKPPFDFSDAFYRSNGIDPSKILNRVDGTPPVSVVDNSNTDPNRRNIRVRETTGGFDASGNVLYYNIFGMFTADAFTNDDAGQQARKLANSYRAFIFPKKTWPGSNEGNKAVR